ncbi:MAG: ATP synthase F1 subunit gamma [Deltaproteobacteria bacterium CG_4_10_14_0_2_um_filter_43_8]|nr:MAG: ATP synthase F1 subunit gamma [Deltaproteobacteria bacterium CG11_big_fil_rev_8_21_14_0_20_42_23]PJA22262.1 MAG: ATP synthase F1 subunit gamma [Deltaproteobacteria bacterium CG_4_10_14_0_2_um_filter_43_8]PJC63503.1 MAG: ATP synthase F1 subunit gamma [Deltaproteobacteria bacterium CG_4_9_14_0_2_um_filter_42_21]
MANLKDIRKRILSVKNTQKVTKAMKLVAAAKLRRAQNAAQASRIYMDNLLAVARRVAAAAGEDLPVLMNRRNVKKIDLVLFTSDRGLCGGFNENLLRAVKNWIAEKTASGFEVYPIVLGKKGRESLSRARLKAHVIADQVPESHPEAITHKVSTLLTERYYAEETDSVVLVYNHFISAGRQEVLFDELIPLSAETSAEYGIEYLCEPERKKLLAEICEETILGTIRQAFLDSYASELASRMQAMDSATKNASDMIADLALVYNRARQAAITSELIDILGGAEAIQ